MTAFGTLRDHKTGDEIRPATAEEWRRTADVLRSGVSWAHTGVWEDEPGHGVWVDGGPEPYVSQADVRELRDEAAAAGDLEQVRLCDLALGEAEGRHGVPEGDACRQCETLILDTRMRAAENGEITEEN